MYEIDTARVRSPLDDPKWDLKSPRNGGYTDRVEEVNLEDLQSVIKLKPPPKKSWEPDVKAMISTKKWLSTHGLKRNRLSLEQILPAIGFKHSDDFDRSLKKPICSRYGEGLFSRYPRRDGRVYNITVSKERLKQIENSLLQAIVLYKRRLEWLTTESRRLFGVIEEHCVTIVIDIKTNNPAMFDHCRNTLIRVVEEQVSQIAKFNLIKAGKDMVTFQDSAVPVCRDSIEKAFEWIKNLDHAGETIETSAAEAVLKAGTDKNIEAVYLFSEGSSSQSSRELLKQKVKNGPMPVNTVAFNSTDSITVQFLKDVAKITGGRFHAFAFTKLDADVDGTSAYNSDQRVLPGGVPPGAGMRQDVVLLWEELEEARTTLSEIQVLSEDAVEGKGEQSNLVNGSIERGPVRGDQYLTSRAWLEKHGLSAKKLDFYDVLANVAFKHCDGVVDVKGPPDDGYTDAASRNKLINAQYCDQFCHVLWRDGTVKHVHVTSDVHRQYERRMAVALDAIQQRIDWLQQGSRELFGTIIEDQVYILIDSSSSMQPHLDLVKEKLIRLMEEQLRHKMKFNLIKFGTRAMMWRDRMVDVNESNLQSAWNWVRGLTVNGSTNTLAALKLALSDPNTQAIYLLTDGRPDQPQKTVLAQVQLQQKVPIHTISFNCADAEANQFLAQLAADTGGRYHYFSEEGSRDPGGPMPFESEDIRLLKDELERGREDLAKIARLRAECAALDWTNSRGSDPGCGREHGLPPRPHSATGVRMEKPKPPMTPRTTRPMSAFGHRETTTHVNCLHHRGGGHARPMTPSRNKQKLVAVYTSQKYEDIHQDIGGSVAGHTRTSLMRTMSGGSSSSFDPAKQWMLPETRALFEKQWTKFKSAMQDSEKIRSTRKEKSEKEEVQVQTRHRCMVFLFFHSPMEMSSKRWLKFYGLKARKLTIMDALAPTVITQRAKYVPIIDKYVLSKVFDEILPLAHTTGSNRKEVKLINPHGVNLLAYEERLRRVIEEYKARLDAVVWNALSQEEKDNFGAEHVGPISFLANKLEMMQALDRLGWPISENDIVLLEEEIELAAKYIQQSKDLRKAAERKSSIKSIDSYSRPKSGRKSKKSKKKTEVIVTQKYTDADSVEGDIIDDGDEGEDVFEDKSSSVSVNRDYERKPKSKKGVWISETSSSKKPPISRRRIQRILDKRKGSNVIARNPMDGLYYPGSVISCPDPRHIEIGFRDEQILEEVLPSRFVIPIGGAQPCPMLRPGDYVLVKTGTNQFECWVPGIIQHIPQDHEKQAKYYTVMKFTGKNTEALRKDLIKITKSRFSFALRYIVELQRDLHEKEAMHKDYHSDEEERRSRQSDSEERRSRRKHRKHRHRHRRHRKRKESSAEEKEMSSGRDLSASDRSRSTSRGERVGKSTSSSGSRSQSPSPGRSHSGSRRHSHSRSRSRSRSPSEHSNRSQSRSHSRSRSPSNSRSRSPSEHSNRSRSRSSSSSSSSSISSSSSSKSSNSNRSKISNDGKQGGRSPSPHSSRSRSKSPQSSRSRSRSKSPQSRSKSRSPSPPRSPTGIMTSTPLSNRSRSGSRSRTPSPKRSVASPRRGSPPHSPKESDKAFYKEQHEKLLDLQRRLQDQQDAQRITQEELRKQQEDMLKMTKELYDNQILQLKELQQHQRDLQERHEKHMNETEKLFVKREEEEAAKRQKEKEEEERQKSEQEGKQSEAEAASPRGKAKVALTEGEEVLARWNDDGWYYRGTVASVVDEDTYFIRDSIGDLEQIKRVDIITDEDDSDQILKRDDTVVALHPSYSFSYAPGVILNVYPDLWTHIRYYDGEEAKVPREEVYGIATEKFETNVGYILRCEDNWVSQAVVARNDSDGCYYLGQVKERVGNGRQYIIEWADGKLQIQNSSCIFGAFTKRHRLALGDRVLAIADNQALVYLPGTITSVNGNRLVVKYCNGDTSRKVDAQQCFWLSQDYYDSAIAYYNSRQDSDTDSESYTSDDDR
ncbi:von Willebrand factor A domain-containing protein 3B-like [Ptychodera flava]|uniref:von Willebrand factor A domain-containing protein 3B-like n=1 Tax=Ptychodera flava TaxID=63121 RepID=UPI00396A1CB6